MATIIWSLQAAEQLEALVAFIAAGSPAEGRRFASKIIRRIESLGIHPELGGWVVEDDSHSYRELLHGNYRIIYRASASAVFIVAVRHAARLLSAEELE